MKIYLITAVARQQGGEYVFVNIERAFKDKTSAESYISNKKTQEPVVLEGVQCLAEWGMIEAELE